MTMKTLCKIVLGGWAVAALFGLQPAQAQNNTSDKAEQDRQARLKEDERQQKKQQIYERMAREGISRELVASLSGNQYVQGVTITPYTAYKKISAQEVLKPGEHYRFELDEYLLTMVVPDAVPGQSWIVPYVDTRTEPQREEALRKSKGGLDVANLLWHYGTGVYPLYFGWQGNMSIYITYDAAIVGAGMADISTPEKLRQYSRKILHSHVPAQAEIDNAKRNRMILNSAGNRVFLDAETIVINGRVWTREALNKGFGRLYKYKTVLLPDRMLAIAIFAPQYDYNANPDLSTYPAPLKRAFAQMEEMMASLRVARRNDDGKPDPFVIERVEPAPLPVREKRPNP